MDKRRRGLLKITIIHGQSHKGSTYHIAHSLAEKLGGDIREFFLPRDFGEFCMGCNSCFRVAENACPHYEKLLPITEAIDDADVLILESPVYVLHATGAMKALLDHYGWRWLIHRPEERMFSKQAVCISTAAGAGMKRTNQDMADSMLWWGVAKTYRYGIAVSATSWDGVNEKKKKKIDQRLTTLAAAIIRHQGKVKPGWKTRLYFYVSRMMQKNNMNPLDAAYWNAKGWTKKNRPWKKNP